MRILFVASGNHDGIHHGTKSQIDSIIDQGIEVDVHLISGKGFKGYLKNIFPLIKRVKQSKYDLIHVIGGHVGLVCFLFLFRHKKIISFLGSDIQKNVSQDFNFTIELIRNLIVFSSRNYSQIIVKSKRMISSLPRAVYHKIHIVPNGVDFKMFKPIDKSKARELLNLDRNKKYILFLGDKRLGNKNYKLVEDSVNLLNKSNIETLTPYPAKPSSIPYFMNAADLLILTSYSEGSPNIIKEALACNCPIISSDVGDVAEHLNGIDGCYVVSFETRDVADAIHKVLSQHNRIAGREKITHLDKEKIARRIAGIYESIISERS